MRQSLKFLHTVATAVLVGALLLQLLVSLRYGLMPAAAEPAAAATRALLVDAVRWLLGPSVVLVVVTGLLLMGLNRSFASAGWVWAKALLGLMLVKTVITVCDPVARELLALGVSRLAAGDPGALDELARLARMEWLGTWLAMALAVVAIALGIWRPRFNQTVSETVTGPQPVSASAKEPAG
jgi:uncharacterized membrane protein